MINEHERESLSKFPSILGMDVLTTIQNEFPERFTASRTRLIESPVFERARNHPLDWREPIRLFLYNLPTSNEDRLNRNEKSKPYSCVTS